MQPQQKTSSGSTRTMIVACPNCYRPQPWDGSLTDVICNRCSRPIPVQNMAAALVHLFSSATFDDHGNVVDEEADGLLQRLVRMGWGHAMFIGRHDWVYAGCPLTVEDFCTGIRTFSGAQLSCLQHVMTISNPPEMFANRIPEISAAAVIRLEALVADSEQQSDHDTSNTRQDLYYILARYSSVEAVGTLQKCVQKWPKFDGDSERSIGSALVDALERCGGQAESVSG